MEEDKNLKKLLKEYAFEETSSSFDAAVIQKITAGLAKNQKPLMNVFILFLLKIIFLFSAISLIACLIFLPLPKMQFSFAFSLSSNVYRQLFSFLVIFWIVMLTNTWWNSRQGKSKTQLIH
jgi:O-antigen/teichoic acid export membrane protein